MSVFAAILLCFDCLPFFHVTGQKSPAVVSLRQAGENAAGQLLLEPQEPAAIESGALGLAGGHVAETAWADDCTIPPAFAPFFDLAMDINRAQLKDLTLLPGIGPALAQRIVAERAENGPYAKPEALLRVAGIGPHTFAGLQPHICTR